RFRPGTAGPPPLRAGRTDLTTNLLKHINGRTTMKKLLLATAALALASGLATAQDVVRLGTEGAYPPYNFINDAGNVDACGIELGNELCTRAGLTCEWVTDAWDSIIPKLFSGN